MDFKTYLSDLISKESQILGAESVNNVLKRCMISIDSSGKVTAYVGSDESKVAQKLINELCSMNPMAKIPARALFMVYKKHNPNFNVQI